MKDHETEADGQYNSFLNLDWVVLILLLFSCKGYYAKHYIAWGITSIAQWRLPLDTEVDGISIAHNRSHHIERESVSSAVGNWVSGSFGGLCISSSDRLLSNAGVGWFLFLFCRLLRFYYFLQPASLIQPSSETRVGWNRVSRPISTLV